MSGHNKWSKIKHKKAASDAKKSQLFSKLVKLIQMEVKASGGDKNSPGLRLAIEKAKKANMPGDNIDRAIQKANEAKDLSPVLFEVYGPGGIGIIITALTDNNNRTSSEIKHILSKSNVSLGGTNSVLWNFTKNENGDWVPNTVLPVSGEDEEKLNILIETLEEHDDTQNIYTNAQ